MAWSPLQIPLALALAKLSADFPHFWVLWPMDELCFWRLRHVKTSLQERTNCGQRWQAISLDIVTAGFMHNSVSARGPRLLRLGWGLNSSQGAIRSGAESRSHTVPVFACPVQKESCPGSPGDGLDLSICFLHFPPTYWYLQVSSILNSWLVALAEKSKTWAKVWVAAQLQGDVA